MSSNDLVSVARTALLRGPADAPMSRMDTQGAVAETGVAKIAAAIWQCRPR